jgi:hypothetical protein
MNGWVALSNGLAGFAVGLFMHAIPASWWPRWLGKLVGKKELAQIRFCLTGEFGINAEYADGAST